MAIKKRGISPDLLIHPGETISELLEERGLTQKELSRRAGVSEAFLCDVIHGKKDISKGLAKGLEYALGVPISFWLNLQANYDAEVLEFQEFSSISDEERKVLTIINQITGFLKRKSLLSKGTQEDTIVELRRLFQVSNLMILKSLAPVGAFRLSDKASVVPEVLGAWLCLCKIQSGKTRLASKFEPGCVVELVAKIKKIMLSKQENLLKDLKELFAQYGIDFSIVHNFRGAPVHGYINRKEDGTYQMVLTLRGSFADIFWFSLFHELGHIVNGDVSKGNFIDAQYLKDEKKESAADDFAVNSLLEPNSYERFINNSSFSFASISKYAQTQDVPPYVVIGRLQKEGKIPWTWFKGYKLRYKWAE